MPKGYLNKKYYFLHIPKTAGTSFSFAFDQLFNRADIFPPQTWMVISNSAQKVEFINALRSNNYKLVRGHYANSTLICEDRFVLSFFRNPLYRTISQLKHIQSDPLTNAWLDPVNVKISDTIFNLLNNKSVCDYISNLQTKYLMLTRDVSAEVLALRATKTFYDQYIPEIGQVFKSPTFFLKRKIKKVLDKLDFIGIQEFFPESMVLLSHQLGVKIGIPEEHKMSFGPASETMVVDKPTLEKIDKLNTYDKITFEIAKSIFLKRWLGYLKVVHNLTFTPDSYTQNKDEIIKQLLMNY